MLFRFRQQPYAVSADIEGVFRSFLGPEDVAKQNTYRRNMYLCRPEFPRFEVRIPLKSKFFFLNILNNLEKVLLSIQMYCLLILIKVCLFFCELADFIVSNENVFRGENRAQIQTEINIIQKPFLFKTSS